MSEQRRTVPTAEAWAEWRDNPVTEAFMQYLADYRVMLLETLTACWEAGPVMPEQQEEIRHKAQMCRELVDLNRDDVARFYDGE